MVLDALLRGLERSYPPESLRLSLIDPKGTELVAFESSPYVDGVIGIDGDDAIVVLEAAVAEMATRYARLKAARVRSLAEMNATVGQDDRLAWRVIVLDEYADLTSDPDAKKQIEALLQRLAQKARAALGSCHRRDAAADGRRHRDDDQEQPSGAVALRVRSSTESRVVLAEIGAESLAGKGDAFRGPQRE